MTWELFERKSSGGCYARRSQFMEWVTIFSKGIRFSRPAKERWLGDRKFVEVFIDREAGRIAFKSIEAPSMSAYKVCIQGDTSKGKGCFYIPCRAAVTNWKGTSKIFRTHCTLTQIENGIVELIPESP
jgi:hypothetical protein